MLPVCVGRIVTSFLHGYDDILRLRVVVPSWICPLAVKFREDTAMLITDMQYVLDNADRIRRQARKFFRPSQISLGEWIQRGYHPALHRTSPVVVQNAYNRSQIKRANDYFRQVRYAYLEHYAKVRANVFLCEQIRKNFQGIVKALEDAYGDVF